MKNCGIYLIRNRISEKFYVGSSIDINRRWVRHIDDLNKNKHHSIKLQNSWNKHGQNNFDFFVIQKCDISNLEKLEQKWIDTLGVYKNGYNCTSISQNIGLLPKTAEHKRKIGLAHKGRKLTEESKDKIRQKMLGKKRKPRSQETKLKISQANKGKVRTKEMREHLSAVKTGVPHGRKMTDEHKAALLAGRRKNKDNCLNT